MFPEHSRRFWTLHVEVELKGEKEPRHITIFLERKETPISESETVAK
jgi:hypothetical protein